MVTTSSALAALLAVAGLDAAPAVPQPARSSPVRAQAPQGAAEGKLAPGLAGKLAAGGETTRARVIVRFRRGAPRTQATAYLAAEKVSWSAAGGDHIVLEAAKRQILALEAFPEVERIFEDRLSAPL